MKKIIISTLVVSIISIIVYGYLYMSNANKYYNKGLEYMAKNHFYAARLAFKYVLTKYSYAPISDDAEKYFNEIDIQLKRYFVYISLEPNKKKIEALKTKLIDKGINCEIIVTDNFASLPSNNFILLVDRYDNIDDAYNKVSDLHGQGLLAKVIAAF